jgi:hypothetical protein
MQQTPEFTYQHEVRGSVVVEDLTEWRMESTGMNRVEREWVDCASQPHVTAAVTEFSSEVRLGAVPLAHLVAEWSENASKAGVEKLAFVSTGIEADPESVDCDTSQEVGFFESREAALGWASE